MRQVVHSANLSLNRGVVYYSHSSPIMVNLIMAVYITHTCFAKYDIKAHDNVYSKLYLIHIWVKKSYFQFDLLAFLYTCFSFDNRHVLDHESWICPTLDCPIVPEFKMVLLTDIVLWHLIIFHYFRLIAATPSYLSLRWIFMLNPSRLTTESSGLLTFMQLLLVKYLNWLSGTNLSSCFDNTLHHGDFM